MLRGSATFVCDNCGNKFKGPDFEWQCTVFTAPVKCPNCNSWHTSPKYCRLLYRNIYRDIWKHLDEGR